MRLLAIMWLFISVGYLSGCSADNVQRLSYETIQNLRQQQCEKNRATQCNQRQSYDQYQEELKHAR